LGLQLKIDFFAAQDFIFYCSYVTAHFVNFLLLI